MKSKKPKELNKNKISGILEIQYQFSKSPEYFLRNIFFWDFSRIDFEDILYRFLLDSLRLFLLKNEIIYYTIIFYERYKNVAVEFDSESIFLIILYIKYYISKNNIFILYWVS